MPATDQIADCLVPMAQWQLPLVPTQVTPFHSSRPPAITVKSYLEDRCAHNQATTSSLAVTEECPAAALLTCLKLVYTWQYPQICRLLGRDVHPRADLHGSGRAIQP